MSKHLAKKKKPRTWKVIAWILVSLLVLLSAIAGYMYVDFNNRLKSKSVDITTTIIPKTQPTIAANKPTLDEFEGAFTILLVGNDDGNGEEKYGARDHALNDVNMILHVSADHSKATAISIPRDMFVNIPECTNPTNNTVMPAQTGIKVNEALNRGGLKCVVDTFRTLTGQSIDYAAMIQFEGVVALSNAIGGVPVCISKDIDDDFAGLHLKAGMQTIQGDDALAFLRTRHGVGDGSDIARISNQQVFLSSLMRSLKSKDTLSDVTKVLGIANAVADNMTLSTNLASIPTLTSMAYSLKDIPLDSISFVQYPTSYGSMNGVEGVIPNSASAEQLMTAVFNDEEITISGGTAPGSIGSVEKEPTASPVPSSPVAPSTSPTSQPESSSPSPTASALPSPVALPTDITGSKASQETCSRAFGDY